jgi:hypothetical protein
MQSNKNGRWMKTQQIYQNLFGSMKVVKLLEKNQALHEIIDFIPGHYIANGISKQIEFWSIRKCDIPNKALIMRRYHKSDKPLIAEFASYYDEGVIRDIDLVFIPGDQPTLVLKEEC